MIPTASNVVYREVYVYYFVNETERTFQSIFTLISIGYNESTNAQPLFFLFHIYKRTCIYSNAENKPKTDSQFDL